jgi:hypothetical protein
MVLGQVHDDRLPERRRRDRGLDRADRDLDRFGALPQGLDDPIGGRPDRQLLAGVRAVRHELAVHQREPRVDRGLRHLVERLLHARLHVTPVLPVRQVERRVDRDVPEAVVDARRERQVVRDGERPRDRALDVGRHPERGRRDVPAVARGLDDQLAVQRLLGELAERADRLVAPMPPTSTPPTDTPGRIRSEVDAS